MNNFNKISCQILRDDINVALDALGRKHGIKFAAAGAKFTPETIEFKLNIALVKNGVAVDKDMVTLKRYLSYLGLTEKDLDKTFTVYGKSYKLAGYVPRKYSRPFVLLDVARGTKVVCAKEFVLPALKATA